MTRRRSFTRWVRIVHRWISMVFVIAAVLLILPVLPAGVAFDVVSAVAIILLVLMILTGIWMAVQHYAVTFRRPTARRTLSEAEPIA